MIAYYQEKIHLSSNTATLTGTLQDSIHTHLALHPPLVSLTDIGHKSSDFLIEFSPSSLTSFVVILLDFLNKNIQLINMTSLMLVTNEKISKVFQ